MGIFSLTQELAIDLGTANTLVIYNNKVVVDEPCFSTPRICMHMWLASITTATPIGLRPSIVSLDVHSGKLVAIGHQARQMHEKTNPNIKTIRPLKDGVIADFNATELMLRGMIKKVKTSGSLFSPSLRMVVCIPSGSTNVEIRAVRDSAEHAGGREVYMIYEPMAAALGAGLDVEAPEGNMVIDIGGGTSEIACISLGGIVCSESINVAGDVFTADIQNYVREHRPEYMVPSFVIKLDEIPLNVNGKVDKHALPAVDLSSLHAEYVAATNEIEQHIINAFEVFSNY